MKICSKIDVLAVFLLIACSTSYAQEPYATKGKPVTQEVKDSYRNWACEFSTGSTGSGASPTNLICAFALADDQAWRFFSGNDKKRVVQMALLNCQQVSSVPDTCQVVDIDGKSDFVQTKQLADPEQKFCYETYHEEYGEAKWLEMISGGGRVGHT